MDKDIENELRRALTPREPPAGFAERVLAKLPGETATRAVSRSMKPRTMGWLSVALAASLIAFAVVRQARVERGERQEGRLAKQQVIDALRVTGAKLDLAYRAVQNRPPPTDEAGQL